MDKIYIVVYEDGSFMIFANRQKPGDHQTGSAQYEAEADTTLLELSDWLGSNKPESNFNNKIRITHWGKYEKN